MLFDPTPIVDHHRNELLEEAEHERLIARSRDASSLHTQSTGPSHLTLVHSSAMHSSVRHGLAAACIRLAGWIDDADDAVNPRWVRSGC
jgi:hypothetical protein